MRCDSELTQAQYDELVKTWEKTQSNMSWRLPVIAAVDSGVTVHAIPKDGFSLLLFKSDNMDCGQLDAVHKILRDRKIDNAMIMCLPEGDGFEVLTAEQTLHVLKPTVAALSDADLESIGLQRKSKQDIFDINRSFS